MLGETVCAKTDDVDLAYPGGRWVHWLRQDLSIAYGGSGTTLITSNPQLFAFAPDQVGTWKVTIAETGDISQTPAIITVTAGPESIATYEGTCSLAKNNFTLASGTVNVCAKADPNFSGTRYIYWVDSQGATVQTDIITSSNATASRAMTVAGNWWVYFSDTDGSLRNKHAFTVSDPAQPEVDLSIHESKGPEDIFAGGFVSFVVDVTNRGPDTAGAVSFTQFLPGGTSFTSFSQDSGPGFTCAPNGANEKCDLASLPANTTASFTFVYQVLSGTPAGTLISGNATLTSTTAEIHTPDNSDSVAGTVIAGAPQTDCTLDCPNDIVTTATTHGTGGGANVTFGAAEGFGTCGAITSSPASGSFFPIGTTTVTTTSASGGGGCNFTVTVVDSAAPTIACPGNILVTANAGESQAFVPNVNGSSSNVGTPATTGDMPLTVTGSRDDGEALTNAYPFGITDITWIATDPAGRQATCTQTITVHANTVLTISCPSDKTAASANGCDPTTVNTGTATSNSGTATITSRRSDNLPLGDPYPVGVTTITWTASDVDTQTVSCTQTVTVTGSDTSPPTLTVPPNVSVTTSSCSALLDDELGVATADTSCGTVNITRTGIPMFSCPIPGNPTRMCESFIFPTGTTVITYTATNSAGLTATGTQTVTVLESPAVPPTITAPAAVTLNTGPGATSCGVTVANLDATLGLPTINDNCAGVTFSRTGVPDGNVFPLGNTTVTYVATDKSGNTASSNQIVTVVDNTPPTLTCPADVVIYLPLNSTATSMTVSYPSATATDNCAGTVNVNYSIASGSTFSVGTTPITVTATDAHGNTSTCAFNVTVLYNFTGFFPPIDNLPVFNSMKAGQAAPVKFSLSGNKGLNIFAVGSPSSVQISCQSGAPVSTVEETVNAGGSSLSYSATSDQYNYVWKTDSSWKNTCRQLTVTLNDGSQHQANFTFK
ncbi:MAG TPA: PxKF domain-containing protein [Pyrinomonadaceae bacterium]|nr:PxKF domain-containing protein [Pyrinomonadaceae bacterium]